MSARIVWYGGESINFVAWVLWPIAPSGRLNSDPTVFRSDMKTGRAVQSTWSASNFVTLGFGAGLMALAALEIRSGIVQASRRPTSAQDSSVSGDVA